jgi:hypothetical protein
MCIAEQQHLYLETKLKQKVAQTVIEIHEVEEKNIM